MFQIDYLNPRNRIYIYIFFLCTLSTTDFPKVPLGAGILCNSSKQVRAKSQLLISCMKWITFLVHRCRFIITWTYIYNIVSSKSWFKYQVGHNRLSIVYSNLGSKSDFFCNLYHVVCMGSTIKYVYFSLHSYSKNTIDTLQTQLKFLWGSLYTTDFPKVPIGSGILCISPM